MSEVKGFFFINKCICTYLHLFAHFTHFVSLMKTGDVGIEEDNGLEAREFFIVDVNISERLDQFIHDPDADFSHLFVLQKSVTSATLISDSRIAVRASF